jgi:phosphoglycolate phosphatase
VRRTRQGAEDHGAKDWTGLRPRGVALTPTLLLFDIDGTLIDGAGAGRLAMDQAFLRAFGVPVSSQGLETAGRTDRAILQDMAERAGIRLHPVAWARLLEEYVAVLDKALAERRALLLPGAGELVRTLARDPRCRLAVATGNIERGARIKLRHFGLNEYFPVGGFGDDAEERPAVVATALREASRHYGVAFAPQDCVVIGDSPRDVQAARELGMRAMGVGTGRAGRAALAEARPDVLFPDLVDVRRIVRWLLD